MPSRALLPSCSYQFTLRLTLRSSPCAVHLAQFTLRLTLRSSPCAVHLAPYLAQFTLRSSPCAVHLAPYHANLKPAFFSPSILTFKHPHLHPRSSTGHPHTLRPAFLQPPQHPTACPLSSFLCVMYRLHGLHPTTPHSPSRVLYSWLQAPAGAIAPFCKCPKIVQAIGSGQRVSRRGSL